MKRPIYFFLALFLLCCSTLQPSAFGKRLKLYSFPKTVAAGQLVFITFENPLPETPFSQSKCTADRLVSWVKSDIPILRIEQNGQQVWTSLGSYNSNGDTSIASFMAPTTLTPGDALIYIVNERDASVPRTFKVIAEVQAKLTGLFGPPLTSLHAFRILGEGFVPTDIVSKEAAWEELEHNVTISKLAPDDQWVRMNKRMANDWDKLAEGNFLYIEQNGNSWRTFVEGCGIERGGLALDFTAPPGLKPGTATISLGIRMDKKEVVKTAPITVNVQ
ncbi:MAG: hypothetical protein ABI252_04245 [Candidatus Kapaibacterium sp.]|jgi:hypothetical protein